MEEGWAAWLVAAVAAGAIAGHVWKSPGVRYRKLLCGPQGFRMSLWRFPLGDVCTVHRVSDGLFEVVWGAEFVPA